MACDDGGSGDSGGNVGYDGPATVDSDARFRTEAQDPEVETFTVDPTENQELVTSSGAGISFVGGSLIADGEFEPEGDVTVTVKTWLSGDDSVPADMPGMNFMGQTEDGDAVVLFSWGVIEIELDDEDGDPVNLSEGTALLGIPATTSDAPSEVATWHAQSAGDVWVEQGTATLDGGVYIAEVSHFSLWNVDPAAGSAACIEGPLPRA